MIILISIIVFHCFCKKVFKDKDNSSKANNSKANSSESSDKKDKKSKSNNKDKISKSNNKDKKSKSNVNKIINPDSDQIKDKKYAADDHDSCNDSQIVEVWIIGN